MFSVQDHPSRTPRCFFSYSWDSPEHRAWVQHLAARLRSDGVETILDEWHMAPGTDLPKAIETYIRESDFVVMVCTPRYTAKANAGKGGVGYEKYIVTGEMFKQKSGEKKFVPLVRVGDPDRDMPSFLDSKIYIDFRSDAAFETSYATLLEHLTGGKRPPPIGPRRPPYLSSRPGETPRAQEPVADGIRVGLGPQCAFTSINEAIQAAIPGATIVIEPGTYREPLRITKELSIVGAGPREDVILIGEIPNAVRVLASGVSFRSLTFRAADVVTVDHGPPIPRAPGGGFYVTDLIKDTGHDKDRRIQVTYGDKRTVMRRYASALLLFEVNLRTQTFGPIGSISVDDCVFESRSRELACVISTGNLHLTNCLVRHHDNMAVNGGVSLWGGASSEIGSTQFISEDHSKGLSVEMGADVTCTDSTFVRSCVECTEDASLLMDHCSVTEGTSYYPVHVSQNAKAELRYSIIQKCGEYGIGLTQYGQLICRHCAIHDIAGTGIYVSTGSGAEVRDTEIRDCQDYGIRVSDGGFGMTISDSNIYRCGRGINVRKGSDPTIRNCVISQCRGHGIYIEMGATAHVDNCDVVMNGANGIFVDEASSVEVTNTRVNRNDQPGVAITEGSRATLNDSDILFNAHGSFDVPARAGCIAAIRTR